MGYSQRTSCKGLGERIPVPFCAFFLSNGSASIVEHERGINLRKRSLKDVLGSWIEYLEVKEVVPRLAALLAQRRPGREIELKCLRKLPVARSSRTERKAH